MSDAAPVPQDLLQHAAFVRRLARSLLADAHAAEDVVQETWARGLERPPARGGELGAWLARVATNLAYRRRRTEARRGARERATARAEALPPAEESLERAETLQRVVDAVRALEEPYRATILARFYEDLPPRAIAARAGVSVETVNTRLKRGLAQLRERLARGEHGWRGALGLLAGRSACLPPHAGLALGVALMKSKTIAVAAAGILVVWGWWRLAEPGSRQESPSGVSEIARADPVGDVTPVRAVGREPSPALPPVEPALSGRVLDEQGSPVPEAGVLLMGGEPLEPNLLEQRRFPCDAEGRWRAVLPDWKRVFADVAWSAALEPVPGPGDARWVEVPASDVDFVVRRVPTGTIEVRVVEGAGREPLGDFRISLHRAVELDPVVYRFFLSQRSAGPVLRSEVRVDDPGGLPVRVILTEPEVGNLWSKLLGEPEWLQQDVRLLPGETEQVLFVLPERGVLRGQVVDPDGAPVADASVFFGPVTRARGDEPFKPFHPERVVDAVRTAADGWFELHGDGAEITAGHPDFSVVTVEARTASRIVLAPRGAIRGRLLDPAQRVLAGASLRLDERSRGPQALTDAAGRFAFERVEAGAHALWLEGEEDVLLVSCVRLEPGQEAELELGLPVTRDLELVLRADEPLDLAGLRGLIVGREQVFDLCELAPPRAPDTLAIARTVLPGRYWLATSRGLSAPFTLEPGAERVEIELGSAELVVRGGVHSVQVVPADADPFLRLIAARVRTKLDPERGARFPLVPGRYLLVGEAGVVLREVELPPEGLELALE